MHFRFKKYIESPYGIWCRLRRDIPFLLRGTTYYDNFAAKAKPPRSCATNDKSVMNYIASKNKRNANTVIYTCITGGYDNISQIAAPTFIEQDCDYVCYTDNTSDIAKGRIGVWEIRPLEYTQLDNVRNNRWHKMHPHDLFREYEDSLYIDANVDILSHSLLSSAKSLHSLIAIPSHPIRDCIYDEYANAFAEFIDTPKTMHAELSLIKKSGMPRHYGLTENNVIYRHHNNPHIIQIMDEWWHMTTTYSRRDQLSLAWILWKHGIKISDIALTHHHNAHDSYYVSPHSPKTRQNNPS